MAELLDPDELVNAAGAAEIIGLNNPRGVAVYRQRYRDFPVPAIDRNPCVLWLRKDIEAWASNRRG